MLTDAEGRKVLRATFEARGFRIAEDVPLEVAGATIRLDGFDAQARVGYEYLTTEDGDREEITEAVLRELDDRICQGELILFLVDEAHIENAQAMRELAEHFLDEMQRHR